MANEKRVLLFGDTHCGHCVGLTHPRYQYGYKGKDRTKRDKFGVVQRECWTAWERILADFAPIDVAIHHGDAIDGKGKRSGGTELITTSLEEQCDMAADVITQIRLHARRGFKLFGVYGTPYHVGGSDGEDWENILADRAGFDKLGSHEWIDVGGIVFDVKHKVGSSGIPHGRATAIKKEELWNTLWHDADMQPRADVLTRGHVHFYQHTDTVTRGKVVHASTLPALQAMGSKYGARQCSGLVHFGAVLVTVKGGKVTGWHPNIVDIRAQKARVVKA